MLDKIHNLPTDDRSVHRITRAAISDFKLVKFQAIKPMQHQQRQALRESTTEEIHIRPLVLITLSDSVTEPVISALQMAGADAPWAPIHIGEGVSDWYEGHMADVVMGEDINIAIDANLRRLFTDQPAHDRIFTRFVLLNHKVKGVEIVTKHEAEVRTNDVKEESNIALERCNERHASFHAMNPSIRAPPMKRKSKLKNNA